MEKNCTHPLSTTPRNGSLVISLSRNGYVPSLSCFCFFFVVVVSDGKEIEVTSKKYSRPSFFLNGFSPYLLLPKYWQIGPSVFLPFLTIFKGGG